MAPINRNINVDSASCLSIGTCVCLTLGGSCSFAKTQQQLPHKKRKRDLLLANNTMAFDDDDDGNTNVCLHLLLGPPSCTPTCCCDESEKQVAKNHKRKYQKPNKHKTCKVDDGWEIKKVLHTSDICSHKTRLLLNKDLAEKFVFPVLLDGSAAALQEGVQVQVWDIDTKSPHSLVFKYWPSAKCYVFTTTWTKGFVNRRELKKGDQIGFRWDQNNQRFDFSVLKKP